MSTTDDFGMEFLHPGQDDDEDILDLLERGNVVLGINENGDVVVWRSQDYPDGEPLATDASPIEALKLALKATDVTDRRQT